MKNDICKKCVYLKNCDIVEKKREQIARGRIVCWSFIAAETEEELSVTFMKEAIPAHDFFSPGWCFRHSTGNVTDDIIRDLTRKRN